MFQSLPSEEQQRVYGQWASRQQGVKREQVRETPKGSEDVERRVSEFFEAHNRRPIPDNPHAAMQLMMLQGVLTKEDEPHYERVQKMVEEKINEQERAEERREQERPWWRRVLDIEASQRVAARWTRDIVALQLRTARVSPQYTKLMIFDFDGTSFRSPPPPADY